MLTTVFKDKIPKGISYPLPLEFLKRALPGAAEQAVAAYFVHSSHWNYNVCQERPHMPRAVLSAGNKRPMFRNNNQKVAVDMEDYDWHFVLWGMPSESRHVLRREFESTAAQPLARWLVDRKPRSSRAQVWWYPETQTMLVDFR
jgi:hypothetical protein